MRIHRVALRDFRGVDRADVVLDPDGVTVIQGPNEVGKSSIADAIDMLLDDLDSSTRSRVRDAQPVGRDVGPWVEMEVTTGPYRFMYSKQWIRQPATQLRITEPAPEQLTGRAAHERVQQILDDTTDRALFGALRQQQGVALDQAALEGNATLAGALDRAASGSPAPTSDGDSVLFDAIVAERAIDTTAAGRPNAARIAVAGSVTACRAVADEADAALAGLEERAEHHRRITAEIAEKARHDAAHAAGVADMEARLAEINAREALVREREAATDRAESAARDAERLLADRQALAAEVTRAEAEVAEIAEEAARADAGIAGARADRDGAAAALLGAQEARVDAEARLAVASADADHQRDVLDRQMLFERRDRAARAEADIGESSAFLESCRITSDLLDAIEQTALTEAEARGRAGAPALELHVTALAAIHLEIAGEAYALAPGQDIRTGVDAGAELRVPGVVRVRVDDRRGRDDTVAEARRAAHALRVQLEHVGVQGDEGVFAARALDRRRRDEEGRLATARAARDDAVRDLTLDALTDKMTRCEARIADYTHNRTADAAVPADLDAANVTRAAIADMVSAAGRDEVVAREAHAAADTAVRGLEEGVQRRTGRMEMVQGRLADAGGAVAAARARVGDAALREQAQRLRGGAKAAARSAREAAAALAADDPVSVRSLVDNARDALERLRRERQDLEVDAVRLSAEIAMQGDEGLAARAAAAHAALGCAEDGHRAVERRATAAEVLHECFARHRDIAQRTYVAPFRDEVERLARLVFGPSVSVEVDHSTLRITSRTLAGVTVPFEALSGGAREQLAVIGRLACAILVAPDGGGNGGTGAPVIFDDALGYSDPGRLQSLGAAIATAGRRCQVIVLTCMPDRYAGVGSARVVRLDPDAAQPPMDPETA